MQKKVRPTKKLKASKTQKPLTTVLKRTQRTRLRKLYSHFFGKQMPDELLVELEKKAIKASEQWPVPLSRLGEKAGELLTSWIDNEIRNMRFVSK